MDLNQMLHAMAARGASDLHIKAGGRAVIRVHGELKPLEGSPTLSVEQVESLFQEMTTPSQRDRFKQELELDFSYQSPDSDRYRVNASRQRGTTNLALRRIPSAVPTLESLRLPPICAQLAMKRQGLILLTGPTGSGKSTTLAAMIEHINHNAARRIVTIEDPVEYIYTDYNSVITQREIGRDTHSFAKATRQALRQDPDVILVGEMRDRETMAACLTAAETGHLLMSTLHTNSGPESIDRIVDSFPDHRQGQIRMQLSLTLEAVLTQALLPRLDGTGRVPAVEVMIVNSAIRNLIREGKTHQMGSTIQTGRQQGMQTLDQSLEQLYREGLIDLETARKYAQDADTFQAQISR